MTRINLIEPSLLSDQHLVAEYREIFMVGSALQRSLKSPNWYNTFKSIPLIFTLNNGHVKFFYNKGKYLHKRYLNLIKEMKYRGMKPDPNRKFKIDQWPKHLYKDWEPNKDDLELINERINGKIKQKPNWYRWTKRDRK
tara:strand:- start:11492 stop:11908 length:417 start_codon:yes stop_codon:yes gene_type:complete